jgi:exopolyphosphatase/guanosine-5'-triphosphate,3'-diphosphate pyrophosphatase
MSIVASIDVGSNAMRLAIAQVDHNKSLNLIETDREPIRLGTDVFTRGKISKKKLNQAIEAFLRFQKSIISNKAMITRTVGTSALREATNQIQFVNEIAKSTEIEIEIISSEEEARLIHLAVTSKLDLNKKMAILVDIGGGSIEISFATSRKIITSQTLPLGTVRLLNLIKQEENSEFILNKLVNEYVSNAFKELKKIINGRNIDLCIGTGGNLEALGKLGAELYSRKENDSLTLKELDEISERLLSLTYKERMEKLGLRPDRADVIIPATMVLRSILYNSGLIKILIPHVGLKEGVLIGMIPKIYGEKEILPRDQIIESSKNLGKKYNYDEKHAHAVTSFALQIFDSTKELHNLNDNERVFLESASILHEIGQYVGMVEYSKHSYYLINASRLIGLNTIQKSVISNIVRYHHDLDPKIKHRSYRNLPLRYRSIVSKLSAILQIADALDDKNTSNIKQIEVNYVKPRLYIRLKGKGELLVEKWAVKEKCKLFESIFNVNIITNNDKQAGNEYQTHLKNNKKVSKTIVTNIPIN